MILPSPGERPTIYTNVHATSTFLVKKYLLNNSVRQNKVRTPFDLENLPSLTQRISRTAIASEGVPTPPVDSLRSLCHDRLYMNMQSKCISKKRVCSRLIGIASGCRKSAWSILSAQRTLRGPQQNGCILVRWVQYNPHPVRPVHPDGPFHTLIS